MRMSPSSKIGMSPLDWFGGICFGRDFGDEFAGARASFGDLGGRGEGLAPGGGFGAVGRLRSAGETTGSRVSGARRRGTGFAPARPGLEPPAESGIELAREE